MSVEKWNRWVAKFEGYVKRTWMFKLMGVAVIFLGYLDMRDYPLEVENVMVFSLIFGILLLIVDVKES